METVAPLPYDFLVVIPNDGVVSGVHDMGGTHHDGTVNVPDHVLSDWEALTDALAITLAGKGLFVIDEIRRAREQLPPETYLGSSYYELWILGVEQLLVEKGILDRSEIERRTNEIRTALG